MQHHPHAAHRARLPGAHRARRLPGAQVARRPALARRRTDGGQAVVELALVLPLLMLVVLIAIDFGRLYATQITVNDASRQASRYGASNPADQFTSSPCGTSWNGTIIAAEQEAAGSPVTISCGNVGVTEAGPDGWGSKYVTTTVTAPFSFVTPFLSPLVHLDHLTASNTDREFNPCTNPSPVYAGEAWAAAISGVSTATVPGLLTPQADGHVSAGDTGALPPTGGNLSSGPLSFSIPNVLSGSLLADVATGGGCSAAASSRVASVAILSKALGANTDIADVATLASSTSQVCGASPVQAGLVSSVTIAGQAISLPAPLSAATTTPNYTITVPGSQIGLPGVATAAVITLNSQSTTSNPPATDAITINFPAGGALSPYIVGTVTVAHAQASCS